jgi:hypothetical protein
LSHFALLDGSSVIKLWVLICMQAHLLLHDVVLVLNDWRLGRSSRRQSIALTLVNLLAWNLHLLIECWHLSLRLHLSLLLHVHLLSQSFVLDVHRLALHLLGLILGHQLGLSGFHRWWKMRIVVFLTIHVQIWLRAAHGVFVGHYHVLTKLVPLHSIDVSYVLSVSLISLLVGFVLPSHLENVVQARWLSSSTFPLETTGCTHAWVISNHVASHILESSWDMQLFGLSTWNVIYV